MGAAVHACSLLCHVIRLVGDAARREVERRTRRIDGAKVRGGDVERLVPANHAEAPIARAPYHRLRQPAQVAQLLRGQGAQRYHVGEPIRIQRRRRVQPQELQPHHAQVRPLHRPVAKPCGAKGAAVADALGQDPVRERQLIAIGPRDPRHVEEMVGLPLADSSGHQRGPGGGFPHAAILQVVMNCAPPAGTEVRLQVMQRPRRERSHGALRSPGAWSRVSLGTGT